MIDAQQEGTAVGELAAGRPVKINGGGVIVGSIEPAAPVAHSGLRVKDVIRSLNGASVWSRDDLVGILRDATATTALRLGVVRAGRAMTITTTPWMHEDTALVGIAAAQAPISVKLDPTPKYLTGNVGGPSAGLVFALDVYDALTGRKLTRGTSIAVTGTISLNGSVGEIGGVTQKAIGASQAGATVFLVPPGNLAEARKAAPRGLRVIAVASFRQALQVIRSLPVPLPG
jgi:PDZ domain-containing protein